MIETNTSILGRLVGFGTASQSNLRDLGPSELTREAPEPPETPDLVRHGTRDRRTYGSLDILLIDGPIPERFLGRIAVLPAAGIHVKLSGEFDRRIYFVVSPALSAVKIGIAAHPESRPKIFRVGCPDPALHIAVTIRGNQSLESELHHRFRNLRIHGEWYRFEADLRLCIERIQEKRDELRQEIAPARNLGLEPRG